nr:proteasome activator subunit 4 isoform X2 [Tanacetum cinerariifolium]
MLISRVTGKSDFLLATIYIFGLKLALQRALLWSNPTILGEVFSLARVAEARFANQRSTTTSATPNLKPPTSPILTIGGSQNTASDSSTTPEVSHEVATELAPEALRQTTTVADKVAKIEETCEFYTSESEEHGTKPEKRKSNDDGFKWGVQEASTFEEHTQRLSTTLVLSLLDFNEGDVEDDSRDVTTIRRYRSQVFIASSETVLGKAKMVNKLSTFVVLSGQRSVVLGASASGLLLTGSLLFVARFYAWDMDGWHVKAVKTNPTEICFNKLAPSVGLVIRSTEVKNDGSRFRLTLPNTFVYCSIGEYDYGKNHDMKPSRITMTDDIGPTDDEGYPAYCNSQLKHSSYKGKCVAREHRAQDVQKLLIDNQVQVRDYGATILTGLIKGEDGELSKDFRK